MNHLNVPTAFHNSKIDDDNLSVTMPKGLPESLNISKITIRLRIALYCFE